MGFIEKPRSCARNHPMVSWPQLVPGSPTTSRVAHHSEAATDGRHARFNEAVHASTVYLIAPGIVWSKMDGFDGVGGKGIRAEHPFLPPLLLFSPLISILYLSIYLSILYVVI